MDLSDGTELFFRRLELYLLAEINVIAISGYEDPRLMAFLRNFAEQSQRQFAFSRGPQALSKASKGKQLFLTLYPNIVSPPNNISDPDIIHVILAPGFENMRHDCAFLEMPLPDKALLSRVLETHLGIDEQIDELSALCRGLTYTQSEIVARLCKAEKRREKRDALILREKIQFLSRDALLESVPSDVSLDDVGGMSLLKQWLQSRKLAFTQKARDFGLPYPKGLLLIGMQGCGKSLIARAIATFWGLPLFALNINALRAAPGGAEAALDFALKRSEAMAPLVLWCDEIEKNFANGQNSGMLSSLLGRLQNKNAPVFFVATANSVEDLPPELIRKGRFDEQFFIDLPDEKSRVEIFSIHLKKLRQKPSSYPLELLASKSPNFSGAEIEACLVSALFNAFSEQSPLTTQHILGEISACVPLFTTKEKELKALREWGRSKSRAGHDKQKLISYFNQ